MLITKYSLLIVFIFSVFISISIGTNKKDTFQMLSDNNNILVKREIKTLNKNIFQLTNNFVSRKKRPKLNIFKVRSWKTVISYFVDKRVDRTAIDASLQKIESETCLRFVPIKKITRKSPPMFFGYAKPCKFGKKIFFKKYIDQKCYTSGYFYREIFHQLGLVYEHQRRFRTSYIYINKKAIHGSVRKYFTKFDISLMDKPYYPYDYGSIMQPDQYFLATKGIQTIVPSHYLYRQTMGQNVYPSFLDFKRINEYYCKKECHKQINCKFGGYPHPELCKICKCIFGHVGPYCERFNKPTRLCPTPIHVATNSVKYLHLRGIKNCAYLIKGIPGKRISLKILNGFIFPDKQIVCSPDNSLEVKYLKDITSTGARFCGKLSNIGIISQDYHVYVYYKSRGPINNFFLKYKLF